MIADKTVRVGDKILQFRVQAITQSGVTLIGDDGKSIVLTMDN